MRLLNEIAKRGVAVLLLAATAFASIAYSLGAYDFTFIDRPGGFDDERTQEILGTLRPGDNISEFTGDPSDVTYAPETPPVTDLPATSEQIEVNTTAPEVTTQQPSTETVQQDTTLPGTTTDPEIPPEADGQKPLADYLSQGYSITWADFDPQMEFAEIIISADGLDSYTQGNSKLVRVQLKKNYGENHREIAYYALKTEERPTLEVYMGYIIVDAGIGNAISGINAKLYSNANRVSIYSSEGKFIGNYPSEEVIPAYTRDSKDRPVFYYNNVYYYLDSSTGKFELSDFNPDTDSRGLYFDYNPDFGKSDCQYNIYGTEVTVTETFTLDTTSTYTRYGVDSRLAEQIYLYYPKFANQIAYSWYDNGQTKYYNYLFAEKLKEVIKGVQSGEITRPPETTTAEPETTVVPETSDPETSAEPETTVVVEPEITLSPETTVESETEPGSETAVDPETDAAPDTDAQPETGHVITDETTALPPEPRTIVSEAEDADDNGVPDKITLDITYNDLRFTYRASKPKEDRSKTTSVKYTHNQYVGHTISWDTDFKYAQAYNFSESRAYTVDANGIVKIINTSGNSAVYLYNVFKTSSGAGSFYHFEYYTEPFERDEYKLGHYYYDDGLIRMRVVERLYYKLDIYENDYEVLLDKNGKKSTVIPEGYNLVSYSDSVLLLERNGRYGYYHRDGYWVAQPIYTYAAPFIEGVAVLGYTDGVKGVIDTAGNIVIPFEYTSISNASTGIFACYSEAYGWKVFAKVSK